MKIHVCSRCEGCGYVTGTFRFEVPWTRWASPHDQAGDKGVFQPHPCPDCGGTGALIETMPAPAVDQRLPTRRGLPRLESYAEHVADVLRHRHPMA